MIKMIRELQKKLNRLLGSNIPYPNDEILKLSEELDILIVEYVKFHKK